MSGVLDSEQRYSVVKRLSVNVGAIQAANKGDVQTEMLLDIQRKLESLGRRTMAPTARAFFAGEWPSLVRKAMRLLFGTLEYLQAPDSIAPGSPEFIGRFEAKTREWGARRARDIQVSLISDQRRFVYHDWHELIGSPACFQAQDGGDIYDDVFDYPFGVVVWTDNTTNVPGSPIASGSLQRLSLALFCNEPRLQHRIVVETHQEIP
jgi:hypothetical protein